MTDLEFDSSREAEAFLTKLRDLWGRVQDYFGWTEGPRARIAEDVESKDHLRTGILLLAALGV
jgi:hypothetical protein